MPAAALGPLLSRLAVPAAEPGRHLPKEQEPEPQPAGLPAARPGGRCRGGRPPLRAGARRVPGPERGRAAALPGPAAAAVRSRHPLLANQPAAEVWQPPGVPAHHVLREFPRRRGQAPGQPGAEAQPRLLPRRHPAAGGPGPAGGQERATRQRAEGRAARRSDHQAGAEPGPGLPG